MHKGIAGGWAVEDICGFVPEIICGIFIFADIQNKKMNFWLCRKGVDMSKYLIENLFGIEGWSIAWYGDILTIFKIWKGGLAIYGGVIGGLGRF